MNSANKLVIALFIALAISACATAQVEKNPKRSFTHVFHIPSMVDFPSVGEIKTVEVGESLIGQFKQTSIPAIEIEKNIVQESDYFGKRVRFTILAGQYVERGRDAFGTFYEAPAAKFLVNGVVDVSVNGIYVLGAAKNGSELFILAPNEGGAYIFPSLEIPFVRTQQQTRHEASFKKELVYAGISQNVISILYREFKDDMARPAFSQELKYDLLEGKVVGYRGSRFEILQATNQGLTYKTLKSLD